MAKASKYSYLLEQYPEAVHKEQFRIMCHISKKTARYLLQTGLVPCVQSGKKTRNYIIKMKDIVRYLEQRERHPERYKLPPGSYNGTYKPKPVLPDSVNLSELRRYYSELFKDYPDVLTTKQAAQMSGSCPSSVVSWIKAKKLKALPNGATFYVPKCCLIDYMVTPDYRLRRMKSNKQLKDIGGFLVWQQGKSL